MVETVTIAIGDSFAQRHERLSEDLGEQYDERMRTLIENEIHTVTQEIERQAEQAEAHIDTDPDPTGE